MTCYNCGSEIFWGAKNQPVDERPVTDAAGRPWCRKCARRRLSALDSDGPTMAEIAVRIPTATAAGLDWCAKWLGTSRQVGEDEQVFRVRLTQRAQERARE